MMKRPVYYFDTVHNNINHNNIKNYLKAGLIIFMLLMLNACDNSDNIPIQVVNNEDTISDTELKQIQAIHHHTQSNKIFYFGFDLRNSPQEDTAQYLPFLNYLEKATGYRFKIYFTPKHSTAADELGQNHTQFAAMGATSFLYAQTHYGAISLVRGLNSEGKAEYQSVFVVRPNSPINTIQDIKGKRLAFGSKDSTQGHLIPRIILMKNQIPLDSLASYTYTGSHHNCSEAVISGRADVCGMQDQLAYKLAAEGFLKIIYKSSYYPTSGIVANTSVPTQALLKVKQALLDFEPQGKDRQGLYHWEQTEMPNGFIASEAGDYKKLLAWSLRLGFLQEKKTPLSAFDSQPPQADVEQDRP